MENGNETTAPPKSRKQHKTTYGSTTKRENHAPRGGLQLIFNTNASAKMDVILNS